MESYNVYKDIQARTNGQIYVGVVGPVRTGKSTFIKRFMDLLVLPNIGDAFERERATDELPQSAAGKTIMTTEPKFVPNDAVQITVGENINLKVRLVDCVGFLIDNAIGHMEDDMPRMVATPWFEEKIPFEQAAEMGTGKVIKEHSTIGIVVTTDGSITEIDRRDYVGAEEKVVEAMQATGKPFTVLLNSINPRGEEAMALAAELRMKYKVPVIPVNCVTMSMEDLSGILETILYEFPICEIGINIPEWVSVLGNDEDVKNDLINQVKTIFEGASRLSNVKGCAEELGKLDYVKSSRVESVDAGNGSALIGLDMPDELFFTVLSERSGLDIRDNKALVTMIKDLGRVKREHERLEAALKEVELKGYGIVMPSAEEMTLEEPEIVKQGSRFGVRLRASAPSIHMIKANIETEISPFVGTEKQSEELVNYILSEFEEEPDKIWSSNLFGKPLNELMGEGLQTKLGRIPDEERIKLQETLQRIINDGGSGLICIIL